MSTRTKHPSHSTNIIAQHLRRVINGNKGCLKSSINVFLEDSHSEKLEADLRFYEKLDKKLKKNGL